MTPFHSDDWLTVYAGDCRTVLATLPAESVHCVVTSPPYWGLRDYGTASWEGGDEGCDHAPEKRGGRFATPVSAKQGSNTGSGTISQRDCSCGATRIDSQLGLEPTPEQYVENMVAVFREVKRVLRNDGTLWLNLGDSYAAGGPGGSSPASTLTGGGGRYRDGSKAEAMHANGGKRARVASLKPKDLVGIPWRVAFALQTDGWYLRSDIIWSKPNPMPESVTDRPTKSHEYLFLLAKSQRYYFDQEAVREATAYPPGSGWSDVSRGGFNGKNDGDDSATNGSFRAIREARNIRSVWTIPTQPYAGAHFATFPPKLVEPCIKAGCPENGTVLDPFAGSGTVGMVAQSLSRRAVLIDLNPEYIKQQLKRNAQTPLGLTA